MGKAEQKKSNWKWALAIGTGLALSPIHNLWLTELVTTGGEVGFFIPAFGMAIWFMGAPLFLVWSRQRVDWGEKKVFIPLIVIVLAMGLSGLVNGEALQDKATPLFMGVSLFTLYLSARVLGRDIFVVFIPFVVLGAISVVVSGILLPGQYTGGFITNYCASAGYLILGTVLIQGRWQRVLIMVSAVGLFFIGALEAVFIVGVLCMAILWRRDLNRYLVAVVGTMTLLVGWWAILGYLTPLYTGNDNVNMLIQLLAGKEALTRETLVILTSGRWDVFVDAVRRFSLTGYGYSIEIVQFGTVHNLPLIIMHQIGPVAAVAWSFVTVYCVVKTKWKYAWIAVMAMCVWDHYIWTQFAPLWWALVGVSTASDIKSDLIFKKEAIV